MSVLPIKINLVGTRGDDVFFTFTNFTVDNKAYPDGTTVRMFLKEVDMPANTFTIAGTFNNKTEVVFKFLDTDNALVTQYDYDVEVIISPDGDIFTHIIGQVDIKADVG